MMLNHSRNSLPGVENAGEIVKKAAIGAAQIAKDATSQVENWAKDGYGSARDAVKAKPFMLGAASLGLGAFMGGLYALWQRAAAKTRSTRKTLPVRARATMRTNGNGSAAKTKTKRKTRTPRSTNA